MYTVISTSHHFWKMEKHSRIQTAERNGTEASTMRWQKLTVESFAKPIVRPTSQPPTPKRLESAEAKRQTVPNSRFIPQSTRCRTTLAGSRPCLASLGRLPEEYYAFVTLGAGCGWNPLFCAAACACAEVGGFVARRSIIDAYRRM